ncbi:AAA family ATPase [Nocardia wallacei]|uniref:AAA family ATPase n=1 Tax=Nocardia wallacei TaxID=480035 RepID=UPI00245561F5|nr:LuxR family transcriptional regulator [Nocardia wallacei]
MNPERRNNPSSNYRSRPTPETAGSSSGTLHGRDRERAALAALIDRARAGEGGAAVVSGEPGIGKSALLSDAADNATGMRVLRVHCAESEADMAFATLHQLLLPGLHLLHEPQSEPLRAVFGLWDGPASDSASVGSATLALLSRMASEQPLLCLVDDAHWADSASIEVLEFVARRVRAAPVAVVFALCPEEGRRSVSSGDVEVRLTGLDRRSARELLVDNVGQWLTSAQQNQIVAAAGGNPLAIRGLPVAVPHAGLPPNPLPIAERLRQAFLRRVRHHREPLRQLLLLIAAEGRCRWDVLSCAATLFEPNLRPTPDLLMALDDLVVMDGSTVAFRHPLVRSAVYYGAAPSARKRAHRALAGAGGRDAVRRAWHLGQAADERDEAAAEEFERAARLAACSSSATAAVLLARAVELGELRAARPRRLFESATAWWRVGDFDRAQSALACVDIADPLDGTMRIQVAWLRAAMELRLGRPADAVAMIRAVLDIAVKAPVQHSVPLLMLLWEASSAVPAAVVWDELSEVAERLSFAGSGEADLLGRMVRGCCRVREGKDAGLHPGDLAAVERSTDPGLLSWATGAVWELGDRARSRRLSRLAIRHARRLGTPVYLVSALRQAADDESASGHFDSAEALAEEGLQVAEATGQRNAILGFRGCLVVLAALRGREQQARSSARELIADALGQGAMDAVIAARRALGLLDLAAGRPEQALVHLGPLFDGSSCVSAMVNVPDLVEAAVQLDRPALAAEPLALFSRWAKAIDALEPNALVARCRALLSPPEDATTEFLQAVELHERGDQPLETARTLLLFGRHLRRRRRRSQARAPLWAALEAFHGLGAEVWAERARDELCAMGETVHFPVAGRLSALTPQESRIATAVSQGSTNRDIAAQLFLSPRTVDHHLRKIFRKTGVGSRAELTRLVLTENEGDMRGPPGLPRPG